MRAPSLQRACNASLCKNSCCLCGRCKEHGVTVQAAISAASMLTMARAQAPNHPLPQHLLLQAPINMRSQARTFSSFASSSCFCFRSSVLSELLHSCSQPMAHAPLHYVPAYGQLYMLASNCAGLHLRSQCRNANLQMFMRCLTPHTGGAAASSIDTGSGCSLYLWLAQLAI